MVCCRAVPRWPACCLVAGLALASLQAREAPREAAIQTARQLWAVADLVLDKHIAPPTRQGMLLAAVRSMTVDATVAAGLGRKVSEITTPEQLAELLRQLWPQTASGQPVNAKELSATLSQVMLRSTPGSPELVSSDTHKVLEQISHNRYVGTGIQVTWNPRESLSEIINPFPGGPARKAGARPGDLILEVDGVDVAKMPLGKVVDLLRGEDGSAVSMTVRQKDSSERRALTMKRGVVPLPMLLGYRRVGEEEWSYRVEPDAPVAYVRVARLTSSAVHDLRQIERRLQADGCRALILDLRFAQDGDVQQGVLTADALLESGALCKVRDRQNNVREYRADPDCLFRGWPMAVLVSPVTREPGPLVLAASLQTNGRVVLVGEPTRGDAYVTSSVRLPDELGVVRLATATVELPVRQAPKNVRKDAGRDGGVQPDHLVVQTPREREALMVWHFAQEKPGGSPHEKVPEDPVLAKAVALLKAALMAPGGAQ